MRKIALALAVAASVIAVNKPEPAHAQFWTWVMRAGAAYGGYSCLRYGCGPVPPISMWGRPRGYGGPPGPYAYYRPSRYRCTPQMAYYGYC